MRLSNLRWGGWAELLVNKVSSQLSGRWVDGYVIDGDFLFLFLFRDKKGVLILGGGWNRLEWGGAVFPRFLQ